METPFFDPSSGERLVESNGHLVGDSTGARIAPIRQGIPRFVEDAEDYAENFGWQWNRWTDILSDSRTGQSEKRSLLLKRTHFADFDLQGKKILECGMGGGDDTEVFLSLPFGEVHAFDLSRAVDRAQRHITDDRLTLSQASIYSIPYEKQSFDFVVCHRVIHHTPKPSDALKCVCDMVKPGGVLFVESYRRSIYSMMNYKYKYRWITRHMRPEHVYGFVEKWGRTMHWVNNLLRRRSRFIRALAYNFVPFEHIPEYGSLGEEQILELEKLVTFDALTPRYDKPTTAKKLVDLIEKEGFCIEHLHDEFHSTVYCTARRVA